MAVRNLFLMAALAFSVFGSAHQALALSQTALSFSAEHEAERGEIQAPEWKHLNLYYPSGSLAAKLLEVANALVARAPFFVSTCSAPVKISYTVWNFEAFGFAQNAPRKRGPVVILPGRGEASFKYIETAFDLYQRGYGPIYALDLRGQGLSDRIDFSVVGKEIVRFPILQGTTAVNHVDLFECYIADFKQFMNEVVLRAHRLEDIKFIAHSTGATVLAGYLNEAARAKAPVPRKIAYVAPMFGIDSLDNAILQICLDPLGSIDAYFRILNCRPENGCMDIAKERLANRSLYFDTMNLNTRSKERFLFSQLEMNFWPQAITESVTTGWIQEARRYLADLDLDRPNAPQTEVLAFKAGQDQVIDNHSIDAFCENRRSAFKSCMVDSTLQLSFHSMLIEKDDVRQPLLEKIDRFFQDN